MSLRLFSAVLIALALLFSPVARMSESGMAMAGEMTTASQAGNDHCDGTGKHGGREKAGISCASACAAVHAMLPAKIDRGDVLRCEHASETPLATLTGIFTEFDTPPPRV